MNGPMPMVLATAPEADFAEIAGALGVSLQAVKQKASTQSWPYREQPGRGGKKRFFPLASLPADVREAITTKRLGHSIANLSSSVGSPPLPALPQPAAPVVAGAFIPDADLTDKQRLEKDARTGVVAAIRRYQAQAHCSQEAALQTLLTLARSGRADQVIVRSLQLARDSRGRKGADDDGLPSIRSLKRWLVAPDLAPRVPQQNMSIPTWAPTFLTAYRTPQKPSVEEAYRLACNGWGADRPSIHQVRRFLGKLGTVTRERGRMGPRELKNIQPFKRRDFAHLEPNDVWSADGHTFDAEVQHPLHGRPFRPEITTIVDIATRRAVGWSVDLAESGFAVADAVRYGVTRRGIPAIFYVDNGSGYTNAMMKDADVGLFSKLGTSVEHSLPYNSQARGVIERLHQTLWVAAAKRLPSYIGAAMDREARLEQFKLTRRALKSGGAIPLIPWDVFVAFCEERVAEYNARAHRSLKGTSPDLVWRSFEVRGWQPEAVEAEAITTLFRPRVKRILQRAEIHLFTNIYFSKLLEEFHGMEVHVAYDIHDPQRIWVYLPDGRFVCDAEWNGNRTAYFPVSAVQKAREIRAKGRLSRVNVKRDEIMEELHGGPALAAPASSQIVLGGRVIDSAELEKSMARQPAPIYHTQAAPVLQAPVVESPPAKSRSDRPASENYADWVAIEARVQSGEEVGESEARWHRTYQRSAQFRAEAEKRRAAA